MFIEDAFEQYSEKLFHAMVHFSRDEAAARDAVSEAFTKALMNQTLLESMPNPAVRAWLYSAARNALIDMKRKEKHIADLPYEAVDEDLTLDLTNRILVETLLNRLPLELKTPLALKYYQGFNSIEIGQAMGIPAATVRTRLRVALNRIRVMMKGEF